MSLAHVFLSDEEKARAFLGILSVLAICRAWLRDGHPWSAGSVEWAMALAEQHGLRNIAEVREIEYIANTHDDDFYGPAMLAMHQAQLRRRQQQQQ